jgi:hypothetical protein
LFAQAARRPHRALDIGLLGILVKEEHDLTARALPRIAVLQPPGTIAKRVFASIAFDLN